MILILMRNSCSQEGCNENDIGRIGLGDAMGVKYLDHGGFCHTCEHCNAGLYASEVVKKDGRIMGGSLCCHNGKAAWLETHFPEMPDSTKRQENIYNPD